MEKTFFPQDAVYWNLALKEITRLEQPIEVDVVVVGGGMAGISAAHEHARRGLRVALVERAYCGAGASGKSSGFITPDSEFSLADFVRLYDKEKALRLWKFALSGVDTIRKNIVDYKIECDYQQQDTLIVATSEKRFKELLVPEHELRSAYGYQSSLYTQEELRDVIHTQGYYGGIAYGDTFVINGFKYCQEMKRVLRQMGVVVFEESPVIKISSTGIQTANARVDACYVVIATDRFLPELVSCAYDIYHVQTFLMLSDQLSESQVQSLFPHQRYMTWDTDLIYKYFRLTPDNRLLLGGANLFSTYAAQPNYHNERMYHSLMDYFNRHFPEISISWEYMWPGLIGVTKDIMPYAGIDKTDSHLCYISGAAGLPWAAALGVYSAELFLDQRVDLDEFFSPYRSYFIPREIQSLIGRPLSFALSHFQRVKSI